MEKFNQRKIRGAMIEAILHVQPNHIEKSIECVVKCNEVLKLHRYKACAKMTMHKLTTMMPVMYVQPNLVSVNFAQNQSLDAIISGIKDSMASYAMYLDYVTQVEHHRISLIASSTDKPYLHGYKSQKWQHIRSLF